MLGMSATYTGLTDFSGDTDWTYDTKDRLTQETSTRFSGWTDNNAFDSAFNPTTFKGNTRTYNANNQLTTGSMTYDGNGNPTTYAGTSFTYDVENRITAVGTSLTCGYRADGLRAWKQGSTGGKTYFLYDGAIPIIEMDSSGNVANINVFAPDGLVGRKEGSTWSYYTFDQQGNVAQRLNSSQVVQTSRVFDAWGEGAETTQPRSLDCWNYNGQWGYYYDRETSLYYCQNRMYDASTGRWINRDPIGYAGGVNLYGYCSGGSVAWRDAKGLQGEPNYPNNPIQRYPRSGGPFPAHDKNGLPYRDPSSGDRPHSRLGQDELRGYPKSRTFPGSDAKPSSEIEHTDHNSPQVPSHGNPHKHRYPTDDCADREPGVPDLSPDVADIPDLTPSHQPFWRADNPWAWGLGIGLGVVLLGAIVVSTGTAAPALALGLL